MGILNAVKQIGQGQKTQDWNQGQQSSESNSFSMPDPNLRQMAAGDVSTISVMQPIAKLTETAVKLKEKEASEWKEQEQLHGRHETAKTAIFGSHANISETQFLHGEKRVKRGLKAREKGATRFGEYLFGEARPEFVSHNYRVQLSQKHGEHTISQLGKEYQAAVNSIGQYTQEM